MGSRTKVKSSNDFTFETIERDEYEDYKLKDLIVTIGSDIVYTHPSGDSTVTLKKGTELQLYVSEWNTGEAWLDECSDIKGYDTECMGHNNPHVYMDTADYLERLVSMGINTLLMHAVNHDGQEGYEYGREDAEKHFARFGIVYDEHPIDPLRKEFGGDEWRRKYYGY